MHTKILSYLFMAGLIGSLCASDPNPKGSPQVNLTFVGIGYIPFKEDKTLEVRHMTEVKYDSGTHRYVFGKPYYCLQIITWDTTYAIPNLYDEFEFIDNGNKILAYQGDFIRVIDTNTGELLNWAIMLPQID